MNYRLLKMFFLNAILSSTITLLSIPAANAHKVTVFAWVQDNQVHVESKFSGGRRPKGAPIEVYDTRGNKLLEGQTDAKGAFVFDIPKRETLKIVLLAGMGHRAEWIVPASEMDAADAGRLNPSPRATAKRLESTALVKKPDGRQEATGLSTTTVNGGGRLSEAEIESIVQRVVEKELSPIRQMLAESRHERPSLRDILGGIGYIMGLVGLAAYFKYRKNT